MCIRDSYYGSNRQLEYDFVVAPNTSPKAIQFRFDGASATSLDASGNLLLAVNGGAVTLRRPVIYQMIGEKRSPIEGGFQIDAKNRIGLRIGAYDHSKPLVIDPVLVYSTYLGGGGPAAGAGVPLAAPVDVGLSLTTDALGNAYVTGYTTSSNFPVTSGVYQSSNAAIAKFGSNAFITKLDPTGALVFSTYLGGSGPVANTVNGDTVLVASDLGVGIALDPTGNIYIGSNTLSPDFPVTQGAYQTKVAQAAPPASCAQSSTYSSLRYQPFVTKLNATGSNLLYSTYLAGSGEWEVNPGVYETDCFYAGDVMNSIAVDSAGDAYAAGAATSTDFPTTTGAFQTANAAATPAAACTGLATGTPATNGFVAKLNPAGSALS